LISCKSSESVSKAEATTNSEGVAHLKVDGQPITVSIIDETSPSQALANIKVSVAEQQGLGLVSAIDEEGKFYPQLTFLDSGLSQTEVITLSLSPAGDEDWTMSEPIAIGINPHLLHKVASFQATELGPFLADNYPELRNIVFLYTEEMPDFEQSTVSIYTTPFPEVIYAYVQEGEGVTDFGIMPKVYAAGFWAIVVALIIASPLDELIIGGIIYKAWNWATGKSKPTGQGATKPEDVPDLRINPQDLPTTTSEVGDTGDGGGSAPGGCPP